MANFKRKRARINQKFKLDWKYKNKDKPSYYNVYSSTPAWWNIVFHIRPARRYNRILLSKIRKDGEVYYFTCFRDGKKPHNYFW